MTLSAISFPHHSSEPPKMPKARSDKNKYFWKGLSVNSIQPVLSLLDAAWSRMKASNLQLLDQGTMSKETFVSALCIYAHKLVEKNGIKWMEEELRQPFAELNVMVAEDQKMREALKLEEQKRNAAPEGFSEPQKAKGEGGNPPGKKRRRRSS